MALAGSAGYYSASNIPNVEAALNAAYTRHLWVKGSTAPSITSQQSVASMRDGFSGSAGYDHDELNWHHPTASFVRSNSRRASNSYAAAQMSAGNIVLDTWLSMAATFDGATLRSYIGGVLDGTAAKGTSAAGNTQVVLNASGNYNTAPSGNFASGEACELAIWKVVLDASELAALAKGFRASLIRPQSLVFYAPAVREKQEIMRGRSLIVGVGAETVTPHPRIIG